MEKIMKQFAVVMGLISVVLSSQVYAADTVPCKKLKWQADRSYKLSAKLHHAVHIVLPEQLQGEPIVGNGVLWDVEGAGQHLFVKPNSLEKEGYSTTVTAIGKSGNSYDFSLTRSASGVSSCVRIAEGGLVSDSNRSALTRMQDPNTDYKALSGIWQKRYQDLKVKQKGQQDKAVMEAVRKYRFHIYTRYDWSEGSGFIGKNLISDVYDDGRFTYIRLASDNKGLLSLESELGGKKEIIEANFDDVTKMYRVAGIYPAFDLKYNKAKLRVTRDSNETQGAF